jgi:hypothetical protein
MTILFEFTRIVTGKKDTHFYPKIVQYSGGQKRNNGITINREDLFFEGMPGTLVGCGRGLINISKTQKSFSHLAFK